MGPAGRGECSWLAQVMQRASSRAGSATKTSDPRLPGEPFFLRLCLLGEVTAYIHHHCKHAKFVPVSVELCLLNPPILLC